MGNEIRVTSKFKDTVSSGLSKMRDNFDRLGKAKGFQTVAKGVGIGAGIGAWNLLQGAISSVVSVGAETVRMAIDEQANMDKLTASLKANAEGWDGNLAALEAVFAARQKDTAFADDQQREALANLLVQTKDLNKALELEATAMDLARLRSIDLKTSADILGKVYGGNLGILSRYGIQLKKGTTATEALAAIQQAAAGQAEAYGASTAGSIDSMNAAIGDLQEEIGMKLLPELKKFTTWVRDDGVPAIKSLVDNVGLLGDIIGLLRNPLFVADKQGRQWVDTARASEEATKRWATETVVFGRFLDGFPSSATAASDSLLTFTDGADAIDEAGDAVKDLNKDLRTTRERAEDALEALLEATFGPKELELNLKLQRRELRENQKQLEQLRDVKHPTKQTRDDILETKLAIIDNRKEIARTETRLTDLGKISLHRLTTDMEKLGIKLISASDAAWELRKALGALPSVSIKISSSSQASDPGLASGGPALPFHRYRVGENGEETLIMGARGGYVVPHPMGRAGGGQRPVEIPIRIDGREIARVVDHRLFYEG